MCVFVSWVSTPDKVYFLTDDLVPTALKLGIDPIDIAGHEAIKRIFFKGHIPVGAVERECADFSDPANFPAEIVKAIKAGRMTQFGSPDPYILLTTAAQDEYERVVDAAYKRVMAPAWDEYKRVVHPAFWGLFSNPANRVEAWR